MSKKEMLALAAIVASALCVSEREAKRNINESYRAAFADMQDECFIQK